MLHTRQIHNQRIDPLVFVCYNYKVLLKPNPMIKITRSVFCNSNCFHYQSHEITFKWKNGDIVSIILKCQKCGNEEELGIKSGQWEDLKNNTKANYTL